MDVNKFPWPVFTDKPGVIHLNWFHQLDRRIQIKLLNVWDKFPENALSVSLNGHSVYRLSDQQQPGFYEYFLPADIQKKGRNILVLTLNLSSFHSSKKYPEIALHSLTITRGAAILSHSKINAQIRRSILLAAPITLRWSLPSMQKGVIDLDFGLTKPRKGKPTDKQYFLQVRIFSPKLNTVFLNETRTISFKEIQPDKWHHIHFVFKAEAADDAQLEIKFHQSAGTSNQSFYLALSELYLRSKIKQWNLSQKIEGDDLVVIDMSGLSANALPAYGNHLPRAPVIDRLCRKGLLFSDISAFTNDSIPASISLLTGLEPREHGIYQQADKLKITPKFIPEILKKLDYASLAVLSDKSTATPLFLNIKGFTRLFLHSNTENSVNAAYIRALKTASRNSGPVFLWINLPLSLNHFRKASDFDDPANYGSTPKLVKDLALPLAEKNRLKNMFSGYAIPEDIRILKSSYNFWIYQSDRMIGTIIRRHHELRPHRAIQLFLISNHGLIQNIDENLFSKDSLSQDVLNVPVVHAELFAEKSSMTMGNHIDNKPLSLMQLPTWIIQALHLKQGSPAISDLAFLLNKKTNRFIFSEHAHRQIAACRNGFWKMILCFGEPYYRISTINLFNLETDPGEKINVISRYPDQAAILQKEIENYCSDNPRYPAPTPGVEEEADQILESLGYTKTNK